MKWLSTSILNRAWKSFIKIVYTTFWNKLECFSRQTLVRNVHARPKPTPVGATTLTLMALIITTHWIKALIKTIKNATLCINSELSAVMLNTVMPRVAFLSLYWVLWCPPYVTLFLYRSASYTGNCHIRLKVLAIETYKTILQISTSKLCNILPTVVLNIWF